jgi:hypothetical protein
MTGRPPGEESPAIAGAELAADVAFAEFQSDLASFLVALGRAVEREAATGLPPNPIRALLERTAVDAHCVLAACAAKAHPW